MGTLHHTFPLHRLGKLPRIACIAAASVAACGEGASENTGLPFSYTRPERGEPGTHAEVAEVTGLLREGLAHTRYFEFPEARAHGWPQRDPKGRYWYGTEWSGVAIVRTGTSVVLDHPEDGSDNNGLRTAPVLAGACFAHALHPSDELDHLVRKLIRGMSSWILAMERSSTPGAPTLLARAAYPEPVEWELNGLRIRADYSDQRPGVDNEVSEYVHIADNPHWGDVWVKSKRSKDDIGHMLRVMAELESCRAQCPRNARRLRRHLEHYRAWARRVEDDGFASRPTTGPRLYVPDQSLAVFIDLAGTECNAMLTPRCSDAATRKAATVATVFPMAIASPSPPSITIVTSS